MKKPGRREASIEREVEKRREITRVVEELEARGGDPFVIKVEEALRALSTSYDSSDRDLLDSDSEAIESLSRLVKLQELWIDSRLASVVSPDTVRRVVKSLSAEELNTALVAALRPALTHSSVDTSLLVKAARYWVSLKPVSRPSARGYETVPRGKRQQEIEEEGFMRELEEFRKRVLSLVREGVLSIDELIKPTLSKEERVRSLYMLSYVVSEGLLGLKYDPERDAYVLTRAGGKEGGAQTSVVLEA